MRDPAISDLITPEMSVWRTPGTNKTLEIPVDTALLLTKFMKI
jgi:hypothetical protein